MTGNDGNDVLSGLGGTDRLYGDNGDDRLIGGDGDDDLWGGNDNDVLEGGDGKDELWGEWGNDTLSGGLGDDELSPGRHGIDKVDGGAGIDSVRLEFRDASAGVTLVFGEGKTFQTPFGSVSIANVEELIGHGSSYGDSFTGGQRRDALFGSYGDDILRGEGGDDSLNGDDGADTLYGGEGNDSLSAGWRTSGPDDILIDGGAGTDLATIDRETSTTAISLSIANPQQDQYVGATIIRNVERIDLVAGRSDDRLTGGALADSFSGRGGNDILNGGGGDDYLGGDDGSDYLDGGSGADRLDGGLGADVYIVDDAGDLIQYEGAYGGPGDIDEVRTTLASYTLGDYLENVRGIGSVAHHLTGNALANAINGGVGADTMVGLAGDDTYVVDDLLDKVIEAVSAGTDTVQSSVSYALGAGLENLALIGTAAIDGTGNAVANHIAGNSAANVLNGGGGVDTMSGGKGDDTYVVNTGLDKVVEAFGAGIDLVQSSANYTLGLNVENLVLTGGAAVSGTGNGLQNSITGNAAANLLNGGTGADTLIGGAGNDTFLVDDSGDKVVETSASDGIDLVKSSLSYTLGAFVENLALTGAAVINGTGNALGNVISGNGADNRLDGQAGADTMDGGAGNDTYFVDNVGDKAIETSSLNGNDSVTASISYTLGAYVENLAIVGVAEISGTGNENSNRLTGNHAANVLKGLAGDDVIAGAGGADRLWGGAGKDQLSGGAGADGFCFDAAPDAANVDALLDFATPDDTIFLSRAVFTGVASGPLAAGAFRVGPNALDADDRIVFHKASGNLFYDADGSGAGAALLFATVKPELDLSHLDFHLFG